ncbi:hypothetical protein [Arthrobacter sp. UYCo732]|uniref:hypothetical protein n=1 Tax=Arthrobacter sp. UYCo732 TaxID=3156336 RepID=UPI00339A48B5
MTADLIPHATEFVFTPTGTDRTDRDTMHFRVYVRWTGGEMWAVRWMDECWNGTEWEFEPSSSYRDEDFLSRCRFTLEDACWHARPLPDTVMPSGATYAQWQESRAIGK